MVDSQDRLLDTARWVGDQYQRRRQAEYLEWLRSSGDSTAGPSNSGPSNAGPSNAGPSNAGPSNGGPTVLYPNLIADPNHGYTNPNQSFANFSDIRRLFPRETIEEMIILYNNFHLACTNGNENDINTARYQLRQHRDWWVKRLSAS